jgi:hypothetical protein
MTEEKFLEIKNAEDKRPYLEEMVSMLMDVNWPFAMACLAMLKSYQKEAVPYVEKVLASNDSQWIYFTLRFFLNDWTLPNFLLVQSAVVSLARRVDFEEQNDLASIDLLAKFGKSENRELEDLLQSKHNSVQKELMSFPESIKRKFKNAERFRLEQLKQNRVSEFLEEMNLANKQFHLNKYRFERLEGYQDEIHTLSRKYKFRLTMFSS